MLLIVLLFSIALAQHIKVSPEKAQALGIKTQRVEATQRNLSLVFPALVQADPSLAFEVYSPTEGMVRRLLVKEGERVRKGQAVALVYSPKVADLRAQIRIAEVKVKHAEEVLKREEMLYKEEVVPYARYFAAKVEHERALSEYKALLRTLNSLGEVSEDNLVIKSQKSGVVVEQMVVLGSAVDLQKPLMKVQDYSRVWVYIYPTDLSVFKGVKTISLLVKDREYPARVDWISPKVDQETGRYKVRLSVENRDGFLKENMKLSANLSLGRIKGLWLPQDAVQEIKGEKVVFLKVSDGFQLQKVKVVGSSDGYLLVEGLKEGQEVAVGGAIFLKSQVER